MWSYLLNMRRRASNGIEMKLSSALQVLKPLLSTLSLPKSVRPAFLSTMPVHSVLPGFFFSLLSPQLRSSLPAAGRRPILIPQV